MEAKAILVTGIGGNVAQGILRIIVSMKLNVRIIGVDISGFTAGNHLCDATYVVPFSTDENYITEIGKIIDKENVALVIPSTDYEIYYLSENKDLLNSVILASEASTARIYLDKYSTFLYLSANEIPFSKSWLPCEYDFSEENIIAKPRTGRGSRGILINPEKPKDLGIEYMIQPLIKGNEITTAVYVSKENKLHGLFTMERKLMHGTTIESRVIFNYDGVLKRFAQKMIDLGGIMGCFNIQSIVNEKNEIIPFEINCRISGTNSIRHNLGFQDVKYSIQEYLLNEKPDTPKPVHGIATRLLMDVVYPNVSDFSDSQQANHLIF